MSVMPRTEGQTSMINDVMPPSYFKNSINAEVVFPIEMKKDGDISKTKLGIYYNRIFAERFMGTIGFLTDKDFKKLVAEV